MNKIIEMQMEKQIDLLLGNQCEWNEHLSCKLDEFEKRSVEKSLSLVRAVYERFIGFDLISVQSLCAPVGCVYFEKDQRIEETIILARSRKLKTRFNGEQPFNELVHEIVFEMNGEVLRDLRLNAGTVMMFEEEKAFKAAQSASKIIENKIGHAANWIICPLGKMSKFFDLGISIFSSFSMPQDTILMGYKGNKYQSGYIYSPYIPFHATPEIPLADRVHFCPLRGLITRYGKKLVNSDYYATVKLI